LIVNVVYCCSLFLTEHRRKHHLEEPGGTHKKKPEVIGAPRFSLFSMSGDAAGLDMASGVGEGRLSL
jgi:hypothetical protein